jgi:hypothetical protein
LNKVALRAGRQHLVDKSLRQLIGAHLERPHRFRTEPIGPDRPHRPVLRIVHMDERADADRGLLLVALDGRQHGPWRVGEQGVGPLDIHDVGVFRDRPERPVVGHIHP